MEHDRIKRIEKKNTGRMVLTIAILFVIVRKLRYLSKYAAKTFCLLRLFEDSSKLRGQMLYGTFLQFQLANNLDLLIRYYI